MFALLIIHLLNILLYCLLFIYSFQTLNSIDDLPKNSRDNARNLVFVVMVLAAGFISAQVYWVFNHRDSTTTNLETVIWIIFDYSNLIGYFKFISTLRDRVEEKEEYQHTIISLKSIVRSQDAYIHDLEKEVKGG